MDNFLLMKVLDYMIRDTLYFESYGVVSYNELDKCIKLPSPKVYICNTHRDDRNYGYDGHWICIYSENDQSYEVFDSFGLSLSYYGSEGASLEKLKPLENCSRL
jgi:hypothetical protein